MILHDANLCTNADRTRSRADPKAAKRTKKWYGMRKDGFSYCTHRVTEKYVHSKNTY